MNNMAPPKTTSEEISHEVITTGIEEYVKPIAGTMGPGGTNVAVCMTVNDAPMGVLVTQDGTTLASRQNRADTPSDALISSVLGEASHRQLQSVGDGTTTTLVLVQAFYKLFLYAAGVKGTKRAAIVYLQRLLAAAKAVWPSMVNTDWLEGDDRRGMLKGLAMVATHGDESLASLIAEAQDHVGKDGRISVDLPGAGGNEDSHLDEDVLKISSGMTLNTKLAYRDLRNNAPDEKISFRVEDGFVTIISNGPAKDSDDFMKFLPVYYRMVDKGDIKEGTPIVMFATVISPEIRKYAYMNSLQGNPDTKGMKQPPPICVVPLEGFYANEEWQGLIEDLHSIAGGFLFGPGGNADLRHVDNIYHNLTKRGEGSVFGYIAGGIEITTTETTITFKEGAEEEKVKNIAEDLLKQAGVELKGKEGDATISRFLIGRANRMQGKTARIVLRTGPQVDRRRRYDLADDAIRTLGAAYTSGVTVGQGVALSELGISVVSYLQGEYGDDYIPQGLEDATHEAFDAVHAQVLSNMGCSVSEYSDMAIGAYGKPDTPGAYDQIVAYNEDGDGFELISAKDNFIFDGASVGITATEIAIQSAMLLGNTGSMIVVRQ